MNIVNTLLACLVVLGMAALFYAAEYIHFEEADHSPLYQETLEGAFSRFKENDAQVPPGRRSGKVQGNSPAGSVPPKRIQSAGGQRSGPAGQAIPSNANSQAHASPPQAIASPELTQAETFARNKEYTQALALFQAHAAKHPTASTTQHRIADMLQALDRPDQAIAAYRKALTLNPGYTCVYGHIGDILQKQGKPEAAEKEYAILVTQYRQKMQQPGTASDLAKYHLAKFYVDNNRNLDEALAMIKGVAQKNAEQASYWVLLAAAYQKTGAIQETLDTIDKILALKPEYQNVYASVQAHLKAQLEASQDR